MKVARFARCAGSRGATTFGLQARGKVTKAGVSEDLAESAFPAKGKLSLSVPEALYLAKEAGYYTTRELQLQIVKSPPFSPREQPFLLENFFQVEDYAESLDKAGQRFAEEEDEDASRDPGLEEPEACESVDPVIHATIQKYFAVGKSAKFWHLGQEWLAEAEGIGTRKRASAHVILRRGMGLIKVNGESDLYSKWPFFYNRMEITQPFKLTGTCDVYDVFVETHGGGPSGQAGATRLAIARALLAANPTCHDDLQRGFCLFEDTRQRASKMYGRKGRRASFRWNKR